MTTPRDLAEGVLGAIEAAELELDAIETIVHGSTTATNALSERTYPEPAFITTDGFRDTIEMGRPHREHLYDPYQQRPAPLVRRTNRFPVREKTRADGSIRTPLDEAQVRSVVRQIAEKGTQNDQQLCKLRPRAPDWRARHRGDTGRSHRALIRQPEVSRAAKVRDRDRSRRALAGDERVPGTAGGGIARRRLRGLVLRHQVKRRHDAGLRRQTARRGAHRVRPRRRPPR